MYGGHIFHQERHITCPLSLAHVIFTTTVIDPVVTYMTHLPKWLIMTGGAAVVYAGISFFNWSGLAPVDHNFS